MLSPEKMKRINELSRKSKAEGLTDEEAKEQSQLRGEYLSTFRESFKKQLHGVKVVDPLGNDVTPNKLKNVQENNKKH